MYSLFSYVTVTVDVLLFLECHLVLVDCKSFGYVFIILIIVWFEVRNTLSFFKVFC